MVILSNLDLRVKENTTVKVKFLFLALTFYPLFSCKTKVLMQNMHRRLLSLLSYNKLIQTGIYYFYYNYTYNSAR